MLTGRLSEVAAEQERHERARDAAIERGQVLAGLDQTREFAEIDWQSVVNRAEQLKAEQRGLEAASAELARLNSELDAVKKQITGADDALREVDGQLGGLDTRQQAAEGVLREARAILAEDACEPARAQFAAIGEMLATAGQPRPATAAACDRAETAAGTEITALTDEAAPTGCPGCPTRSSPRWGSSAGSTRWKPAELDDSVDSADGYRELHKRLTGDDLPRFRQQFKTYLNQNTIRDIAGFQSQLNKQAELIRERIATINSSLVGVDYNPGRYIRLEPLPSPHADIRDFRADLRACTDDAVSGEDSDQYSEQKFLQVSRIIERFRGREGMTEADRRWTRFVTDVRNWYTFAASERYREDDAEYEHYADSGGKSGGQKEKLAYTILAASLAYQFKLEWGAAKSRTFRFAVIDEAFGRGSDESTRFALELFGRLGLQLLIVTPLQKIHVIEPYVSAVGFVDNPQSNDSRLQTLTIDEYRARRLAHRIAQQIVVGETPAGSGPPPAPRREAGFGPRSGPRGRPLTCPPRGPGRPAGPARGPARLTSARRSGRSGTPARCWRGSPPGRTGSRSASRSAARPPGRSANALPRSASGQQSGRRPRAGRCAWSTSRSAAGTSARTASRAAPGWTATTKPGRCSRSAPTSAA